MESSGGETPAFVEEHVQVVEAVGGLPVHALDVLRARDVRVDVEALYLRGDLLAGLVGEVHDAHVRAFLGKAACRPTAYAARAAGDDRDLAI